jgi:hypothetical protein
MVSEAYKSIKYKTPQGFKDMHKGQSVLIIGTGPSTANLVQYKGCIKCKFGAVIGLNFATNDFEDLLDYHVILEKNPDMAYTEMKNEPDRFRKDLPRILNWKTLDKFPQDLNIYKATRENFGFSPDIKNYEHDGKEGLLIGPQDPQGLSAGTVLLNGIHLACIMGFSDIYIIGADLMFKSKQSDHYYKDNNFYRKGKRKKTNMSPIVTVKHDGVEYETTQFFAHSAKYIDEVIKNHCVPAGINVYDFSNGLLKEPLKIKIDDFFDEE